MLNRKNRFPVLLTKQNYPLIYCITIFFLAQALYSLLDFGYGTHFMGAISQVGTDSNDAPFFQEHFWQSLFYYHLLPPGYMLYAYGFNILFPPNGQIGIYLLHSILGVWAVCSLYKIQERLNIDIILALTLITLFILSPPFNLYQTMGWYDFPTACLLIISTWRITCFADAPTFKNGFIFFISVGLLCSIRSMFHITLYFIPLILISLLIFKKQWKLLLLSAAIPFLIVFSMYFKNYLLFDAFSINTYAPEPLSMITMEWNFPLAYRYEGIKKGYFSDLALCPQSADTIPTKPDNFAYTGYYCYRVIAQKYRDNYIKKLGKNYSNVALLQPIPGIYLPNRTELGNIGVDFEYQKNAVQALIHYPQVYLTNLQESWRLYFADSVSYFYDNMGNARHLPSWLPYRGSYKCYVALVVLFPFLIFFATCCLLYSTSAIVLLSSIYLLIEMIFVYHYFKDNHPQYFFIKHSLWEMLLGIGFILLLRTYLYMKKRINFIKPIFDNTQRIAILFVICNIVYASFMMTSFTGNEQQRYRFYVDGLYIILFGLLIQFLLNWIKPKLRLMKSTK